MFVPKFFQKNAWCLAVPYVYKNVNFWRLKPHIAGKGRGGGRSPLVSVVHLGEVEW